MKKTANELELEREKIVGEIKNVISLMGITQRGAADIIALEYNYDNFYDRFKKHLARSSTKVQTLEHYLFILKKSEKYVKTLNLKAKQVGDVEILGKERQRNLHKLSEIIAEYIESEKD
ncbi:hypothetical protein ACWIYZ_01870 [Ursidibacter arcticus]